MDEIPDDIQKAAEQVEQDLRGHSLPMWIAGIIARALLAEREAATKAERERCALITQKWNYQPMNTAHAIATAIRSGARP